jgi:hypothetical protein
MADGGTIVTGDFSGTATFGFAAPLVAKGSRDAFVVKYEFDGLTVAWTQTIGGPGATTSSRAIANFADRSSVITGSFTSTIAFGANLGAPTLTAVGAQDVFVARYGVFGSPVWQAKAGGPGTTASGSGLGVATQSDGSVVVVGQFESPAMFAFGASSLTSAGLGDVFVARYGGDGVMRSARSAGGTGNDEATSVASFGDLGAILAGFVSSSSTTVNTLSTFGAGEPHQTILTTAPNATDSFVAKYYSYPSP